MKLLKLSIIGLVGYLVYKNVFKAAHDADINRIPSAVEISNALTAHSKADAAELYNMCKNASSLTAAQKQRVKTIFRNIGFPSVMDAEYSRLSGGKSFGAVASTLFNATDMNEIQSIAAGISAKGLFAMDAANGAHPNIYKSTSSIAPQGLTSAGTVKGKSYLGRWVKTVSGYCSFYGNDGNIYWIAQSSAYLVEIK